jgi:hypothetical protein
MNSIMENDASKYNEWIRLFLDHIRKSGIKNHVDVDEGYKFNAVNHFQTHFNLDATDLAGNIDDSIENINLVAGSMYFPKRMLIHYAEDFTEETRTILRNLFDTSTDVSKRITDTKKAFEELEVLRGRNNNEKPANTYITLRFISLLLSFMFPNDYNPLKPAEWKVFARFINPEFKIPQKTPPGEQYLKYNEYIEGLRTVIKKRPEFAEIKDALTDGLEFKDDEFRWVTQDVIFVTARQYSSSKAEELTNEIDPGEVEASDGSKTIVENDNTGFMPLESHLEEYVVKNWENIDFGEDLRLYVDEEGNTGQQYTTDVGIIDILAIDKRGDYVVIELKRANSGFKVVGQVLNYIGWVQEQLSQNNKGVRGLIIVGRADKSLVSALKPVQGMIELREYRVHLELQNIKIQ